MELDTTDNFSVEISGEPIDASNAPDIAGQISRPGVTGVDFRDLTIDTEAFRSIAVAMKENGSIQSFYLGSVSWSKECMDILADLISACPQLNKLYLGHVSASAASWHIVCSAVSSSSVALLDLRKNSIGHEGASCLSQMIASSGTLVSLDIRKNELGVDGCIEIAKVLGFNSSLNYLNIDNNAIGDDGFNGIVAALHANTALKSISLLNNRITATSISSLADLFRSASIRSSQVPLKSIDLMGNKIGNEGSMLLGAILASSSCTLTNLCIASNSIHGEGLIALATGLGSNSTLLTLDIAGNHISEEVENVFAIALSARSSVKSHRPVLENFIGVDLSADNLLVLLGLSNSEEYTQMSNEEILSVLNQVA